MATRIQIRRDTSINWAANNPVLALGEPGLETDTFIVKYGDGSTSWNNLPYANIDSLSDFTTSDLSEGSNLYYTNARVYANVSSLGLATNAHVSASFNQANVSFSSSNVVSTQANVAFNQANVSFTQANVAINQANVAFNQANVAFNTANTKANVTDLTTANIAEVNNIVFFTNERVWANVNLAITTAYNQANGAIATANTKANIADLTTANVTEVNNIYFTNTRVTNALTSATANITLGNVIRVVNYTYDQMQAIAGPQPGWMVFDTSNNVFRGYNGTTWSNLG